MVARRVLDIILGEMGEEAFRGQSSTAQNSSDDGDAVPGVLLVNQLDNEALRLFFPPNMLPKPALPLTKVLSLLSLDVLNKPVNEDGGEVLGITRLELECCSSDVI